jgi:hypothetical protein
METIARATPITGKEGAEIELNIAAEWTKNYRERQPYSPISQFFGNQVLQKLLDQPGCLGIRIYYANSQKLNGWQKFILSIANFLKKSIAGAVGKDHFILVGATAEGLDMLPAGDKIDTSQTYKTMSLTISSATTSTGTVVEQAHPCPGSAGCPQNVLTGS